MFDTVVVACRPDLEQILEMASKPLSRKPILPLTSVEAVQAMLENFRQNSRDILLVIDSRLAPRRTTNAARGALPGLDFVLDIQGESNPPACILILEETSTEIARKIQRLPRCEPLYLGDQTDYAEYCGELAGRLRGEVKPTGRKMGSGANRGTPRLSSGSASTRYALLDINLGQEQRSRYVQLVIPDRGRNIKKVAPLELDDRSLLDLVQRSRRLKLTVSRSKRPSTWGKQYRQLGEDIYRALATDTFMELYNLAADQVQPENIRFRFTLHREMYDATWEAMLNFKSNRPFMIDNMITRRGDYDANLGTRLMTTAERLNVLAIASTVPNGAVPDGPNDQFFADFWNRVGTLPELVHVEHEVQRIAELCERHQAAARESKGPSRVNVEAIFGSEPATDGEEWSLAEDVEAKLRAAADANGPRPVYNIVHFAGHALFDDSARPEDRRAYLIFSGKPRPRAVPIAEFADLLEQAGVQLVYLSCCRSSAAPATFELAINRVPMAIGFAWDVNDEKAVDFAELFYDNLFNSRSLHMRVCQAFLKARKKLYDRHQGGDPIWASPVLIAQPSEWSHVETFLHAP